MSSLEIQQGNTLYFFNKEKQIQVVSSNTMDEAVSWLHVNSPGPWCFLGNLTPVISVPEVKAKEMSEQSFITSLQLSVDKFKKKLTKTEQIQLTKIISKLSK